MADDHAVVREGLRALFEHQKDIQIVAEAANGNEAIVLYEATLPDVSIVDLRLPIIPGLKVIEGIRRINPRARILVLTSYDGDEVARQAISYGAYGFLLKGASGSEVLAAIRRVAAGHRWIGNDVRGLLEDNIASALTHREKDVLALLAQGLKNHEISVNLGISGNTIKVHVQSIMSKLGARDRTEAAVIALKRGLVFL
jgi:DNA-binding NarL/FixJ family response regulator